MTTFTPKLKGVRTTIKAGMVVKNNLLRFRAQVSNNRDPKQTLAALEASFQGQVAITAGSIMEVDTGLGGSAIVEGFGVMRPVSYNYGAEEWASSFEGATGHKLAHIASNMYMDENEQCWTVTIEGGQAIIQRDGADEVQALMASTSRLNMNDRAQLRPLIAKADVGGIIYVDEDGGLKEGFVFAGVEGNDELVQVFDTAEEAKETETASDTDGCTVVNRFQVLAFEAVEPMEFGDFTKEQVLDYYKKLYSNHPGIMEMLRSLIG